MRLIVREKRDDMQVDTSNTWVTQHSHECKRVNACVLWWWMEINLMKNCSHDTGIRSIGTRRMRRRCACESKTAAATSSTRMRVNTAGAPMGIGGIANGLGAAAIGSILPATIQQNKKKKKTSFYLRELRFTTQWEKTIYAHTVITPERTHAQTVLTRINARMHSHILHHVDRIFDFPNLQSLFRTCPKAP